MLWFLKSQNTLRPEWNYSIGLKSCVKLYDWSFQALHKTRVLEKAVEDLTKKIESNNKEVSDKELTREIVELDDVSRHW